jgi:hypothetical protein
MIEQAAEITGLPHFVVKQILDYVNDAENLPHVLIARSNRGLPVADNRIEYIAFDSSKTPEQIAEAIGAGEPTRRGIREVLEKGARVWVIVGPNGFMVGRRRQRANDAGHSTGLGTSTPPITELQAKTLTDAACNQAVQLFAEDGLRTEDLTFYFVLIRADGDATLATEGDYRLKHNDGYTSLLGVIGNCGDLMQWAALNRDLPQANEIMSEMTEHLAYKLSPEKLYISM